LRGWTNASKVSAIGNWRAFRIGQEPLERFGMLPLRGSLRRSDRRWM